MSSARAFTLIDVAVAAAVGITGVALAQLSLAPADTRYPTTSLLKLKHLGQATLQYQADNNNYTPITLSYTRGTAPRSPYLTATGWCTWSAGGKNNNSYWFSASGGNFDIEAADRPLNAYAEPGTTYYAPTFPNRLGPTEPARTTAQADSFKDPSDDRTHQRAWPSATLTITTYNDVGTSYLWNSQWWTQISAAYPSLSFENKFHEATRRMAQSDGAAPSRFVWLTDPYISIVTGLASPTAQVPNWYGGINRSVMLFLDGHAGYLPTYPGQKLKSYANPDYSTIFENLPNPGHG